MTSGSGPSGAQQREGRPFGAPTYALRATLIVLVTAAATGGLTSFGQQYLPEELRSLANASGTWFAVVVGALAVARPRPVLAIILGVLGLIVMKIGARPILAADVYAVCRCILRP